MCLRFYLYMFVLLNFLIWVTKEFQDWYLWQTVLALCILHSQHAPDYVLKNLSKQELGVCFACKLVGCVYINLACGLCFLLSWLCRFHVDDVPIRRYPRKSDATFPLRPMSAYGSIWDASSWATEEGKYKADYHYQPFIGRYKNFKLSGCTVEDSASCRPPSVSPSSSSGLSRQQYTAMEWVQRYQLVYNYCQDPKRDHTQTPEC